MNTATCAFKAVLATIAAGALLWIGGEQHYQSCVEHATGIVQTYSDHDKFLMGRGDNIPSKALSKCSRLPF